MLNITSGLTNITKICIAKIKRFAWQKRENGKIRGLYGKTKGNLYGKCERDLCRKIKEICMANVREICVEKY